VRYDHYSVKGLKRSRESVDGIATRYRLDGPGIESRCGRDFLRPSRATLRPKQPSVQWATALFPGDKAVVE